MGNFRICAERCINHFKDVCCDLCERSCPQQAITNQIINLEQCNACGLCIAVCPVKAIESTVSYAQKLDELLPQATITLNCQKCDRESPFPCLGFIDSRLLWAIAQQHQVYVNIEQCPKCNLTVSKKLQACLMTCNDILASGDKPLITTVARPMTDKHAAVFSRKAFLKKMLGATFTLVDALTAAEKGEPYTACCFDSYIQKQADRLQGENNPLFYTCTVNENCNACGLCVLLCPQKALQEDLSDDRLVLHFDRSLCYHCRVCERLCAKQAMKIAAGKPGGRNEFSVELPHCKVCHKPFKPVKDSELCMACHIAERQKID